MTKVFSGIQPTGNLTLGNYLGAIRNWIKLQDENDCIFSIVDMHAITAFQDPKKLSEACMLTLAFYIASGIDPKKSTIFIQSTVTEHIELAWFFQCITPIGWLNRMTQFKDKAGKNKEKAAVGLYTYPVLMAADILLHDATLVPVGDDQTQHLELTADIAQAFNRKYETEYFAIPKAMLSEDATRVMSLRDGTKKMSKSDESDYSRINLADSNDLIAKKLKKAKTDSLEGIYYDKENRPEVANLIEIYCAIIGVSKEKATEEFSTLSMQQFKECLSDTIIDKVQSIRDKAFMLLDDRDYLHKIAAEGTEKARTVAQKRIKEIKAIIGLPKI